MDFTLDEGKINWPVVLWVALLLCAALPAWIRNERTAKAIIGIAKFCLALWFIRGFADYFFGISFAGRTLDFICEFSLPFIFVAGWRLTRRYPTLQPKWLNLGGVFAVFYWLTFPALVFFLMGIRPHIGHRLGAKDLYDGKYFRYEDSGTEISLAAGPKDPVLSGYRKYCLFERRITAYSLPTVDTIFNIIETPQRLKFDVVYYRIPDTIRNRGISGW